MRLSPFSLHHAGLLLLLPLLVLAPLPSMQAAAGADESGVITLTAANFRENVEDGNTWLVDFYAPWCGHCVKLDPVLDEVVATVRDSLRIGKVDATVHTKLGKEFGVSGFPTLKILMPPQKEAGETVGTISNYEGPRTKEGIMDLATRLALPPALPLPTPEALSSYLRSLPAPGVGFVLGRREGGGKGKGEEEEERAFMAVARAMRTTASFGLVGKEALEKGKGKQLFSNPPLSPSGFFLAKVEGGKERGEEPPVYFPVSSSSSSTSSPLSLTDAKTIQQWVRSNNHPLLSPLGGHNFRQLGSLGKLLVIAVVDPNGSPAVTEAYLEMLKDMARLPYLQPYVQRDLVMGWLDGVRWAGFVKNFGIAKTELPSFFVLDFPSERYWAMGGDGGMGSKGMEFVEGEAAMESMGAFLVDVVEGKVPAKRQGFLGGMPAALWSRLSDMWPWSLGLLLPLGWLIALCLGGGLGNDEEEEELRRERVGGVRRVEGKAEQEDETKKTGKVGREEGVLDDKEKDAGAKKNE
ncbi:hypothetical protein VYU27_006874 [Nannochloropsis oceanica]